MFYVKLILGIIAFGAVMMLFMFGIGAIYLNLFDNVSEDKWEDKNGENQSNNED